MSRRDGLPGASGLPAALRPVMPTALYRIFGEDGVLLYVGISIQPRSRFTDHTRAHWWPSARSHTIEWIEDRREAERLERIAIQTEGPRWNREHNVADIRDGKVRNMGDHRIELRVAFTVSDGTDGGREAAESVVRQLEYLAEHGQLDRETLDMEVVRGTVDGVGWYEKWPPEPPKDDFVFPNVPTELRPLLIAVANIVTEELRQPGKRADRGEVTIQNRIRHAFEGKTA